MNRQWVLARRPADQLVRDDFALLEVPARAPQDGEVACRVLWLSIDAANRAWMQGATYRSAVGAGEVMPGFGVGEVTASCAPDLPPGSIVVGDLGWQEHAVVRAADLQRIEPRYPLSNYLSTLGISGLTAYAGLLGVGRAVAGETVLVSAAAGATGSIAGQIAKVKGCRVVGICGSDEKRAWLEEELGFDATVNHRSTDLRGDLARACPDGVDVYFDNVGGTVLDVALRRMNPHGRIVCCGVVSQYDTTDPQPGPTGVPGILVTRRLTMQGFIYTDFAEDFPAMTRELEGWLADGALQTTEDVLEGLERAPDGLIELLAGANRGKRLIQVG